MREDAKTCPAQVWLDSANTTLLGEPDFGLLTQTEVVNAAQRVCSVVDTPGCAGL